MKIKIITTAKAIEKVNYILGQAIDQLMERGDLAKQMGLTAKDVIISERFRRQMLRSYFSKENAK